MQVVVSPSGAHDEGVGAILRDRPTIPASAPGAAPVRFQLRGEWHEVAFIANRWRVHTTWWLPEASAQREYFKLATKSGLLCVLYHDLQSEACSSGSEACSSGSEAWYCARVYD